MLRDERVDQVVLVDIDKEVLSVCKKFMPSMSTSLDDPRVEVCIQDATKYVKETPERFDVVILDLTDNGLDDEMETKIFGEEFYMNLRKIILDNGVIAQQTYSPYSCNEKLAFEVKVFKNTANKVCYGFVPVPSFPNGNIGILFGRVCKGIDDVYCNLDSPIHLINKKKAVDMGLKCYYNQFHESCCVLPLYFTNWFHSL